MKIETLKARLAQIEASINAQQIIIKQNQDAVSQGFANLNALIGSKTECEHWIKEAEESSNQTPPKDEAVKPKKGKKA